MSFPTEYFYSGKRLVETAKFTGKLEIPCPFSR